jgi:Ni/Co efflux regulator RcnB
MMFRVLNCALLVAGLVLAMPDAGVAKDKGKPEHAQAGGKGNKVKLDSPGKGPKVVPPGQVKRYTRGAKLPTDLEWEDIGDLSKWKLPPPGKGNRYIRVDDEILEIAEDTQTVIDAVGIVGDLLR